MERGYILSKSVIVVAFVAALSSVVAHAQTAPAKPVVGVAGIETAAQNISCDGWDRATGADCNEALSAGFQAMLETAIVKTGKMDVMERGRMDAVLTEQLLAQEGITDSGGQVGGLTGVDYMIYGTVTKFGSAESGFSASTNRGAGSLLGGRTRQAFGGGVKSGQITTEMAVDLRVTDASTGQIIVADSVDGEVKQGSAFSVGGIESAQASADPFADVQRVVATNIAEKIVTSRIPVKVIQVQSDGTLILNYGNVFFAPGDQLMVYEVGETFVDPDTGEVLGSEETEIGRVEITQAEARFSRARPVDGAIAVAAGSTLKRASTVEKREKKGIW